MRQDYSFNDKLVPNSKNFFPDDESKVAYLTDIFPSLTELNVQGLLSDVITLPRKIGGAPENDIGMESPHFF